MIRPDCIVDSPRATGLKPARRFECKLRPAWPRLPDVGARFTPRDEQHSAAHRLGSEHDRTAQIANPSPRGDGPPIQNSPVVICLRGRFVIRGGTDLPGLFIKKRAESVTGRPTARAGPLTAVPNVASRLAGVAVRCRIRVVQPGIGRKYPRKRDRAF